MKAVCVLLISLAPAPLNHTRDFSLVAKANKKAQCEKEQNRFVFMGVWFWLGFHFLRGSRLMHCQLQSENKLVTGKIAEEKSFP